MARKLSRKFQVRNRLIRNQLSSLILSGKIVTTMPKARLLKEEMEKTINKVKNLEGVGRTRMLKSLLYGGAAEKISDEIDRYQKVSLYKLNSRHGDGAALGQVVIESMVSKAKVKNE